jgi:hypothetical protein
MLVATLLRRRLFIVLMTAAHISPHVFFFSSNCPLLTYTEHLIIIHGNARIHIIHHSHTNLYYTTLYYVTHPCSSHTFISSALRGRLAALGSLCPIQVVLIVLILTKIFKPAFFFCISNPQELAPLFISALKF